jgi:hypothetical protein
MAASAIGVELMKPRTAAHGAQLPSEPSSSARSSTPPPVEVFGKIKQSLDEFLASLQTSARASEAPPPDHGTPQATEVPPPFSQEESAAADDPNVAKKKAEMEKNRAAIESNERARAALEQFKLCVEILQAAWEAIAVPPPLVQRVCLEVIIESAAVLMGHIKNLSCFLAFDEETRQSMDGIIEAARDGKMIKATDATAALAALKDEIAQLGSENTALKEQVSQLKAQLEAQLEEELTRFLADSEDFHGPVIPFHTPVKFDLNIPSSGVDVEALEREAEELFKSH